MSWTLAVRFFLILTILFSLVSILGLAYPYELPKSLFIKAGILCILGVLTLKSFKQQTIPLPDRLDASVLVFALILTLTSLLGTNPQRAVFGSPMRSEGLLMWYIYLATFLLARRLDRTTIRMLPRALVLTAGIAAFWVLADGIRLAFGDQTIPRYAGRLVGSFGQANFLALYLLTAVPLTMIVGIRPLARMIVLLVFGVGILLTFSRATFLIGTLITWFTFAKGRLAKMTVVIFVACGITIGILAGQRTHLFQSFWNPTNFESRAFVWPTVLRVTLEEPWVGTGLETLPERFVRAIPGGYRLVETMLVDRSHNLFLDLVVHGGFLLFASYLVFLATWTKSSPRSPHGEAGRALLLSWFTIFLHQQVAVISVSSTWIGFLLMGALVPTISTKSKRLKGVYAYGIPGGLLMGIVVACLVMVILPAREELSQFSYPGTNQPRDTSQKIQQPDTTYERFDLAEYEHELLIYARLEGRSDTVGTGFAVPVTISILPDHPGSIYHLTRITDRVGKVSLTIRFNEENRYDVIVKPKNGLSVRQFKNIFFANNPSLVMIEHIPSGDLTNDNRITLTDLQRLVTSWYVGNSAADLTGDDRVTLTDLWLVLKNMGKRGT